MVFLPKKGHGWVIDVFGEDWRFDNVGRLLDRPDPDTYDPCWCRSGKKFRFCHSNRHKESCVTDAEFLAGWEEAADFETCLAPFSPNDCSGNIIRAHTVQRMGGGLQAIARAGEVYGLEPHPYFFQKNDLRSKPKLVGTRKASTFRGFCDTHDRQLFRVAENHPFTATAQQLLALNFRAVSRRVFSKTIAARHAPRMFDYDRGLPPNVQREFFAVQYQDKLRVEKQLENVCILKKEYDKRLSTADISEVNGFTLYFAGRPEFLCAGLVAIHEDFLGNKVQEPLPPAHLCVYSVALASEWAFVFSWVGPNAAAAALCRSLAMRPDLEKADAVLRYAIEHIDNIYFSPDWWDGLTLEQQRAVILVLTRRMHPHYVWETGTLVARPIVPITSRFARSVVTGRW